MSKYAGKIVTNLAPVSGNSVAFDGTGDWLNIADSAQFNLGTSNYTMEFWVYPTSFSATVVPFAYQWSSAGGTRLIAFAQLTTGNYLVYYYDAGNSFTTSTPVTLNAWNHIALVRNGNVFTLYINGVSTNTATNAITYPDSPYPVYIGSSYDGSTGVIPYVGYVSNLRVVIGTAVYTANFTPPTTPLTPITNTRLLTCQSQTIVDNSPNNFAITVNGNAAVSTISPFPSYNQYNPYTPTLGASTPGVWTLDEAMQAAATRQWNMYDPYFQNTTLLLHGNGTNTAQNNTFLDSSSNNFTITRNGNTTQGTFSPFSQTGWGNYFNGSTDFLRISDNAAFDFGTGAFCIETWFYLTADAAQNGETNREATIICGFPDSGTLTDSYGLGIGGNSTTTGTAIGFTIRESTTTPITKSYTATITKNVWHHVVVCRSGNDFAMFYDGVRVVSDNAYTYQVNTNHSIKIGALIYPTYDSYFPGYISNVRIVKGASVYTPTNSSIVVPTAPLGATSGGQTPPTGTQTSLLTCQSNRFVDNGGLVTPNAITVNGSPSVQAFSPFAPTAAYSASTVGGSGYFDGTGDYLTVPDNTNLRPPNGNFTYEIWWYPTSLSATQEIFTKDYGVQIYFASGVMNCALSSNNSTTYFINASFGAPTLNSWNHIAVVRSGTDYYGYLNGVRTLLGTSASFPNTGTGAVSIGAFNTGTLPSFGYLSGARYTTGALYTASPAAIPTSPPTTTVSAGTVQLLCNFTNAGITDATAKNDLETVGNAQISTTQSKFGGSSMSFDGNGDSLTLRNSQLMNLGASDFTIEFWIYINALGGSQDPLYSTSAGAKTDVLAFDISAGGTLGLYATASGGGVWGITSGASFGTLAAGAWYHVALVRSGSTWNGYLNGTKGSGFPITSSSALASFDGFSIGSNGASSAYLNGYLDDLRITRYARYTANFTPQTSQWQDQ